MRLAPADTAAATWRKSSRSGAAGHCVEVARLTDDTIAVRNSNHPDAGAIGFTNDEWTAFLAGAQDGEFNNL